VQIYLCKIDGMNLLHKYILFLEIYLKIIRYIFFVLFNVNVFGLLHLAMLIDLKYFAFQVYPCNKDKAIVI